MNDEEKNKTEKLALCSAVQIFILKMGFWIKILCLQWPNA